MSSFLIDKNSPIRSYSSSLNTQLHHRSRHSSENESNSNSSPYSNTSTTSRQNPENRGNEPEADKDPSRAGIKHPSMFGYFKSEVARSYKVEEDGSEFKQRRKRIYMSVNTPRSLEKFCAFGLLQCLDSFLNIMTFLPLRLFLALVNVFTYPCSVLFSKKKAILNPAQVCDVLKAVILVVSCFITSYIDTSMVYHMVRTQSTIKFYVIYNMLDVMDKLVSGFGQDVLDSLYWTAVEPRGRKREHFGTLFHLIFAIVYVVIHTGLILIQAITLNVAFNSHNKSLLTIMLSNNFVEIKANLFKRLDKNTLCQITYIDVKERFHYFVLLLFILIHNLLEKNWLRDQAIFYFGDVLIVLGSEVFVDWIKHSFITKINEFSPTYYTDFAIGLAQDIASSQNKHALTDFSDQVCRRMGFTPIPLTCLLYMVCRKSFEISGLLSWVMVFILFLCLLTTKVLNSIVLLAWAQYLITESDKDAQSSVVVGDSQVFRKKEDHKPERAKTESISHCPDITSHLPHSMLPTVDPSVCLIESNVCHTLSQDHIGIETSLDLNSPHQMVTSNKDDEIAFCRDTNTTSELKPSGESLLDYNNSENGKHVAIFSGIESKSNKNEDWDVDKDKKLVENFETSPIDNDVNLFHRNFDAAVGEGVENCEIPSQSVQDISSLSFSPISELSSSFISSDVSETTTESSQVLARHDPSCQEFVNDSLTVQSTCLPSSTETFAIPTISETNIPSPVRSLSLPNERIRIPDLSPGNRRLVNVSYSSDDVFKEDKSDSFVSQSSTKL